MTSIERTAYPRFSKRQQFSKHWMHYYFSLNEKDYKILERRSSQDTHKLCMAIQLKVFQYLGYFIEITDVPDAIIQTIRDTLGFSSFIRSTYSQKKTKYRHRNYIRFMLSITKWKDIPKDKIKGTQRLALEFCYNISYTMDNPADIMNATLEFMLTNKYELPAFSTLDRLVRHVRNIVNNKIFQKTYDGLKKLFLVPIINKLLILNKGSNRTEYDDLKKIPHRPTISNFNNLIKHHNWLVELGNIENLLKDISDIKLSQFSEYASSLDVGNMKDIGEAKRYALIAILIFHAQKEAKDALALTFCKTIFKFHTDAKRELERLRNMHIKTTQKVAEMLERITEDMQNYDGEKHQNLAENIIKHYDRYDGGLTKVAEDCKKVTAYNSKNHFPLLWKYFKSKRAVLFKLLEGLKIQSSTQNQVLIDAMRIVIKNKTKRVTHINLNDELNMQFTGAEVQWYENSR